MIFNKKKARNTFPLISSSAASSCDVALSASRSSFRPNSPFNSAVISALEILSSDNKKGGVEMKKKANHPLASHSVLGFLTVMGLPKTEFG